MTRGALARWRIEHVVLAVTLGLFVAMQIIALHFIVSPVALPIGRHPWWDPAAEGNVWTWANVAVLVLGAGGFGLRAYHVWRARGAHWLGWALCALLLLALSLDDAASFHEKLGALGRSMGGGQGWFHFAWVVPGMLIALAYAAALGLHARRIGRAPRWCLLGGTASLFAGAIGFEMISGAYLAAAGHTDTYTYLYHVEEMLEAIGASLFLVAPLVDLPPEARRLGRPPPASAQPQPSEQR